jgi:hypothetical protein
MVTSGIRRLFLQWVFRAVDRCPGSLCLHAATTSGRIEQYELHVRQRSWAVDHHHDVLVHAGS